MARVASPDRRKQIGQAALRAFSDSGFRRTQVSEIAKLAGTAPGTIYLYTASKEALFLAALQIGLGEEPDDAFAENEDLLETISKKLTMSRRIPSLVLATSGPTDSLPSFCHVVTEIYDSIEAVAPAIRLVERCAQDWPELAALFYFDLRPKLIQMLSQYMQLGAVAGTLREVPDCGLAARLVIETIAWFAIHRHGDADGQYFDALAAKTAVVDALVHAYSVNTSPERPK
jgi:AcrR family transcriptional regulator